MKNMFWVSMCVVGLWVSSVQSNAAEKVKIKYPGGTVRGMVVKIDKSMVVIKDTRGKEKSIPLVLLAPKDIYNCRKQIMDPKSAKQHFELGAFCLKHGLAKEQDNHFQFAVIYDAAYKEKIAALTGKKEDAGTKVADAKNPKTVNPITGKPDTAAKAKEEKKEPKKEEFIEVRDQRGKIHRIPVSQVRGGGKPKAKSKADMKKFLDERLAALNKTVRGGTWRMDETDHFYMFSNVDPKVHQMFKLYNEALYKKLCEVLDHKDGDKLWHNKCPMYYFKTHQQFQTFAGAIDGSPGAGNSGGYFMHRGRDVHIAIPFYHNRSEKDRIRTAFNTLCHEGTHAFLQLAGEDVKLSRWLHEGLAQFIEFLFDDMVKRKMKWPKNNMDKTRRLGIIRQFVQQDNLLSWEAGKERPAGGTDTVGYAFAWTRMEFLYQMSVSDRRKLPNMIKLIKSGKTDDEAMEKIFGRPVSELETMWEMWVKKHSKKGFKFR